ncbi:MAG: hypothetical protein CMO01_28580 [Thalassobius sp.]|nr:hypothetical protein [Thalassovita sp.]
MTSKYSLDWLKEQVDNEVNLKYVFFWGHRKSENGVTSSCFSQWYESSFTIDGVNYKTAEHWMMAQKALLFGDKSICEKIIAARKIARPATLINRHQLRNACAH